MAATKMLRGMSVAGYVARNNLACNLLHEKLCSVKRLNLFWFVSLGIKFVCSWRAGWDNSGFNWTNEERDAASSANQRQSLQLLHYTLQEESTRGFVLLASKSFLSFFFFPWQALDKNTKTRNTRGFVLLLSCNAIELCCSFFFPNLLYLNL